MLTAAVPTDEGGWCQQRFCRCDRAAIECLSNASYDSAFRGVAALSCLATQTGSASGSPSSLPTMQQWFNASLS